MCWKTVNSKCAVFTKSTRLRSHVWSDKMQSWSLKCRDSKPKWYNWRPRLMPKIRNWRNWKRIDLCSPTRVLLRMWSFWNRRYVQAVSALEIIYYVPKSHRGVANCLWSGEDPQETTGWLGKAEGQLQRAGSDHLSKIESAETGAEGSPTGGKWQSQVSPPFSFDKFIHQ